MANFELIINGFPVNILMEGLKAVNYLKGFDIEGNRISIHARMERVPFSMEQVENNKLLSTLFIDSNEATAYLESGSLNDLVDIPKSMDKNQAVMQEGISEKVLCKVVERLKEYIKNEELLTLRDDEVVINQNLVSTKILRGYVKANPSCFMARYFVYSIGVQRIKMKYLLEDGIQEDKLEEMIKKENKVFKAYLKALINNDKNFKIDEVKKEVEETEAEEEETGEVTKEETKKEFYKRLEGFNNHEYVEFYIKNGIPHIKFAEGCHYVGEDGLYKFENNVENHYGNKKNSMVYKTYKYYAEALKYFGNVYQGDDRGFRVILQKERKEIMNRVIENDNYYTPKHIMWFGVALNILDGKYDDSEQEFRYLEADGNSYYYDLVVLRYLNNYFAIPVPILADILQVDSAKIYDGFSYHEDRSEWENEEDYI